MVYQAGFNQRIRTNRFIYEGVGREVGIKRFIVGNWITILGAG